MIMASFFERFFGALIDVIVVGLFSMLYVFILGTKMADGSYAITGFTALMLILILYLYFVVLEAITGKTIGKYFIHIKVVNDQGKKISWGQAIVRNLIRIVDAIFLVGFIVMLISKKNCRLGDMVAKTYVIDD